MTDCPRTTAVWNEVKDLDLAVATNKILSHSHSLEREIRDSVRHEDQYAEQGLKIEELEGSIKVLEDTVEEREEEISQTHAKAKFALDEVKAELAEAKEKLAEFETIIKDMTSEMKDARARIAFIDAGLPSGEDLGSDYIWANSELTKRRAFSKDQISRIMGNLKRELDAAKAINEHWERQRKAWREDLEKWKGRAVEAEAHVEDLIKERDALAAVRTEGRSRTVEAEPDQSTKDDTKRLDALQRIITGSGVARFFRSIFMTMSKENDIIIDVTGNKLTLTKDLRSGIDEVISKEKP
jgi:chromosome segregation ATPase